MQGIKFTDTCMMQTYAIIKSMIQNLKKTEFTETPYEMIPLIKYEAIRKKDNYI